MNSKLIDFLGDLADVLEKHRATIQGGRDGEILVKAGNGTRDRLISIGYPCDGRVSNIRGIIENYKQQLNAQVEYRLVKHDEIIEEGDEILDDDSVTWNVISNSHGDRNIVGFVADGFNPIRRRQ